MHRTVCAGHMLAHTAKAHAVGGRNSGWSPTTLTDAQLRDEVRPAPRHFIQR